VRRFLATAGAGLSALLLAGCTPTVHTWSVAANVHVREEPAAPSPTAPATSSPAPPRTPAPTPAATPPAAPPPATADPPGGVSGVGDSVMLGASSALRRDIPSIDVDAVVSRQWDRGIEVVTADRDAGRLRPTLVVHLGTNGTVAAAEFDAMMRAAAGARRIVVVTLHVPRPWEAQDNAVLRAGVARWPQAVLADWSTASAGHPEWFASDGYHLGPAGARAYADLVAAAVASRPPGAHTAGAGGADD
jgi:hypothetical protein